MFTSSQIFISSENLTAINRNRCHEFAGSISAAPEYSDGVRYVISAVLVLILFCTILGNGTMLLAILTHKKLHTLSSAYVVSLAVADLLIAILVMPFYIYQQVNSLIWNIGETMCLVTSSFYVMLSTTSIYSLCCLTIDRYIIICRPFIHQKMKLPSVGLLLSLCWILPIFISFVPVMNNWNQIGIEEYVTCAYAAKEHPSCLYTFNKPFAMITSILAFYVPAVCMLICYVQIYKAAKYHARQISRHLVVTEQTQKVKSDTRAMRTIFAIIGCFFICWFPLYILSVIDPFIGYKTPYIPWTISIWLGLTNSMFNPILLCRYNAHYKKAIRRIFNNELCRGTSEFKDEAMPMAACFKDSLKETPRPYQRLLMPLPDESSQTSDTADRTD